MQHSEFTSLLNAHTRDEFDCVVDIGLRNWPPNGRHKTPDDGLVHLFYVLDGILSCQRSTHLTRVLPRELLRVGGSDERVLENPSRSDVTSAVHMTLTPSDNTPLSTRHHYFSDDQKDNKLYRVAAFERDGRTLATRAPIDVHLTTLGKYDTLLLDRHAEQPLLILCVRGKVTINSQPAAAGDQAVAINVETATVTGLQPCTVLSLRGPQPATS